MIYFLGHRELFDIEGIEMSSMTHLRKYFEDKDEVGFDTETEGFDPYTCKLISYQLGTAEHQFVVDASAYPIENVRDILENKLLIIHNAKFDLKFCYHQKIYPKRVWDTYLGECVLHKGDQSVRKSLEAVVDRYFKYHLTKSTRGIIFREGFSPRVIDYCAEDVEYLNRIKAIQIKELKRWDLLVSMSLENEFVKVLTYIEYCGIYLDRSLWTKKIEQDKLKLLQSKTELDNWIITNNITEFIDAQLDLFSTDSKTTIEWSSPKQVVTLFNKLGIDTKIKDKKTGELKDSVDSKLIEKQKSKNPLIPIYLTYKKREKILSTYGESILQKIHPLTGRIHTQFTQIMDTGRLSSGGRLGDKETINLQNIPALPDPKEREEGKIYERDCFVAPKGRVLIDADYSGQEQIVFANWTQDPDILSFYRQDLGDMHKIIVHIKLGEFRGTPYRTILSQAKA